MRRGLAIGVLLALGLIGCACSARAALPAPNHPLFFGYWHPASAADGQRFNCDDYYSWEPTVWWVDGQGVWGYKTIINHDQLYPIPRGSFDYWPETLGWTNGYVSESRDTSDLNPSGGQDPHLIWEALWVARQVETMERAVIAGKDIYWEVRMPFLGITGALPKIIVAIKEHDTAHPEAQIWPRVKYVDVADSPKNPNPWTASNISGHIQTMTNKLALYGMPTGGKLFGITVDDAGFPAAKASGAGFVQFNAYLDAPASGQQGDTQQLASALDAKLASYITQLTATGKKTFLRLQGFDGGGCWRDMNTVAELNRVAYRRAATDPNVIGLTIWNWAAGGPTTPGAQCPSGESSAAFAWGSRPNGPRDLAPSTRTELRAAQQEIWQAISGVATDTEPPAPVTNVGASAGTASVTLTWTNPSTSDFTGVMIRRKMGGYPTSSTDGSLVVDRAGSPSGTGNHTDNGLYGGITYFYSLFAHDAASNYAAKVDKCATLPYAGHSDCFDEPFAYPNGTLGGLGGWTGSDSAIAVADATVKITGGSPEVSTLRTVSCNGGHAGIIRVQFQVKTGSGSGATMWSVWIDDTAGNNLARWYGNAANAVGRAGGTSTITAGRTLTGGWDNLEVRIDTVANTSEYFFNGAGIGTLSHAGAGDTAGRVLFQRIDNSGAAGHYLFFDNLTIGAYDGTAPAGVTSFTAMPGDGQARLSWVNPSDGDYSGTMVRCNTTGYPTSAADGALVVDRMGVPGAAESCLHTGAANGVTYYYSAFAHDPAPNYGAKADATATPARVDPAAAKLLADGTPVTLTAGIVSAVFADCFYVQSAEVPVGIRVQMPGHTLSVGQIAWLSGVVQTNADGEKLIVATP